MSKELCQTISTQQVNQALAPSRYAPSSNLPQRKLKGKAAARTLTGAEMAVHPSEGVRKHRRIASEVGVE